MKKEIYTRTRIIQKHEKAIDWEDSDFVPLPAELIIYDKDDTYKYGRIKIGDGETQVNDLPFITDEVINIINTKVPVSRTVNEKALSTNITLNASDVRARPDTWIPSPAEVGALPLSGGTMTGPIVFPTDSGAGLTSHYISAGGGYSPNTGKYGLKLLCCDQSDSQTGLGQDLTNLPGGYEVTLAGGRNAAGDTGYISFGMHSVNSNVYDRLGYFDNWGNFNTKGTITAPSVKVGSGKMTYDSTNECINFVFE